MKCSVKTHLPHYMDVYCVYMQQPCHVYVCIAQGAKPKLIRDEATYNLCSVAMCTSCEYVGVCATETQGDFAEHYDQFADLHELFERPLRYRV